MVEFEQVDTTLSTVEARLTALRTTADAATGQAGRVPMRQLFDLARDVQRSR